MANLPIYIIAWLTSVLMMTIFSILISFVTENEYREPTLLSKLLGDTLSTKASSLKLVFGYIIHFAIGGMFVFIYIVLYRWNEHLSSLLGTLLLGILFGGVGVLGWAVMFYISNNPPRIEFKGFYLHLIFAHIIFCFSLRLIINWYFI